VCLECGHGFDLTPAKYVALAEKGDVGQSSDKQMRGGTFVRCPKCQKMASVIGTRCPKDGTPVPRFGKDGTSGRCSKCNWSIRGK